MKKQEKSQGVLSDKEFRQLLRLARQGDTQAKETIIRRNLPLVQAVVRRFSNNSMDNDDLVQVGSVGLILAVDSFDMSYNVRFSTYAVPKIMGEIRRYIRENSSSLHVTRSLKELATKAIRIKEQAAAEGRSVAVRDIAAELSVATEELVAALEAVNPVESLHRPIAHSDQEATSLEDYIAAPEQPDRLFLRQALQSLEKQERTLLYLRFFQEMSQSAAAVALNMSQPQVSRLERKLLKDLRQLVQS